MLTAKQKDLLLFIHRHLQDKGVSPSFDEMKDAVGLKSKSGIHRLIGALEERQFLRRLPNRARALEIIKLPQDQSAPLASPDLASDSKVVHAPFGAASTAGQASSPDMVTIPLHGKIAAGSPIEALEQSGEFIDIPSQMAGRGSCFALTIDGDSMIEKGIMDGDVIIVEATQQARDGDIVVALVDNEEATLKTLKKDGSTVLLVPANRDYGVQSYSADRVSVQAKLVGLYRTYH